MYDFEDVNRILSEMRDEGMIEPIDDDNCHPMDWAEVVGCADEIFDDMYPCADILY
jgi:hypothetical protein